MDIIENQLVSSQTYSNCKSSRGNTGKRKTLSSSSCMLNQESTTDNQNCQEDETNFESSSFSDVVGSEFERSEYESSIKVEIGRNEFTKNETTTNATKNDGGIENVGIGRRVINQEKRDQNKLNSS